MSGLTQLEVLRLENCNLLPQDPEPPPDSLSGRYHCAGTAALLSVLPKLSRLQSIIFKLPVFDVMTQPLQHYSALTASSFLSTLRVSPVEAQALPTCAVQHMFPAGKTFADLKELCLGALINTPPVDLHGVYNVFGNLWEYDVEYIVAACPGLTQLGLICSFNERADLPVLRKLPPTVVDLSLGGGVCRDKAAALVAELTQLTSLDWLCAPEFTDAGLQKFTALTSLGRLYVPLCPCISKEVCEGEELHLFSDDIKVRQLA